MTERTVLLEKQKEENISQSHHSVELSHLVRARVLVAIRYHLKSERSFRKS